MKVKIDFYVIFAIEVPCDRISCPGNRFKQIQETHVAYSASEAMYVVFQSNSVVYILCTCAISRVRFLDLFGPIAEATNLIT